MAISNRLARLEKETAAGQVKRIVITTFNKMNDGLYRDDSGQPLTPAEFEALEATRQVIVVQYGGWPPAAEVETWVG